MHLLFSRRELFCGFAFLCHSRHLKLFDRGPHAKTDAFGHLRQIDHVVGQKNAMADATIAAIPDRAAAAVGRLTGLAYTLTHEDAPASRR